MEYSTATGSGTKQQQKKRRGSSNAEKHHKKRRFMWSDALHEQFVTAILDIGLAQVTSLNLQNLAPTQPMEVLDLFLDNIREFRVATEASRPPPPTIARTTSSTATTVPPLPPRFTAHAKDKAASSAATSFMPPPSTTTSAPTSLLTSAAATTPKGMQSSSIKNFNGTSISPVTSGTRARSTAAAAKNNTSSTHATTGVSRCRGASTRSRANKKTTAFVNTTAAPTNVNNIVWCDTELQLSAEALSFVDHSSTKFYYKEFPHLKDIEYVHHHHQPGLGQYMLPLVASTTNLSSAAVTEETSLDSSHSNSRPFSPLSSEIDRYEFNWEKEDFDSDIIRLYLDL